MHQRQTLPTKLLYTLVGIHVTSYLHVKKNELFVEQAYGLLSCDLLSELVMCQTSHHYACMLYFLSVIAHKR